MMNNTQKVNLDTIVSENWKRQGNMLDKAIN